jgi:hypothetical protein
MVLALFNIEALKERFLGHSVCPFAFASSNAILLRTADISALRRVGFWLSSDGPFRLFALKAADPQFLDHSKIYL